MALFISVVVQSHWFKKVVLKNVETPIFIYCLRSMFLRSDSIIDLHEHFQHDQPSVTNYSAPPEASYPQGSYSDGYSGAYSGAYSGGGK